MIGRERPQPPTVPESVLARRVLVLAPHYDDEVLGCGGLLLQLAAAEAEVVCVFLSDGSGGVGGPPGGRTREQYSERRRREADRATAALGIGEVEHFGLHHGLADGSLISCIDQVARHIEDLLERLRPDLVLTPSPLEATPDHRATFRALHEALVGRRRARMNDGEPTAALGDQLLRVLCYEINHPFYPDLLVDVTAQIEEVAGAMFHYKSQLEQHDYLAACRGLRRFRALSLPAQSRFAEGYCRLAGSDFTTRSPAQLIAYLGGSPSLVQVDSPCRVSIVVRTFNRPNRLSEALGSLTQSTYRNVELVLVNDGGLRPAVPAAFPFEVRLVDLERNQGRAGAAQAGIEAATGECIGFLDDDDLVAPEHLECLVGMLRSDVEVAYSDAAVVCYAMGVGGWKESSRGLPYSRDFDRDILLLDNYIPFHTVLMTRDALERAGPFDTDLPAFEDWDLLIRLSRQTPFVHLARTTCEYRHFLGGTEAESSGGHALGGSASGRHDFKALKERVLAKYADEIDVETLAGAVMRMRRDAVLAAEAARSELCGLKREMELVQAANRDRGREVARLYTRERDLLDEIEAMKATRAWRLHETLQSWRGSR